MQVDGKIQIFMDIRPVACLIPYFEPQLFRQRHVRTEENVMSEQPSVHAEDDLALYPGDEAPQAQVVAEHTTRESLFSMLRLTVKLGYILHPFGRQYRIGIYPADDITTGRIEPGIAREYHPLFFRADNPHERIPFRGGYRRIGRVIIDHDDLIRLTRLFSNRVQAACEMALFVISRYDNANAWIFHYAYHCMAQPKKHLKKRDIAAAPWRWFVRYWRGSWWHKTLTVVIILAALLFGGMYGIALWYQHSQKGKPLELGVSFIADYASYLGEDPHTVYQAILNDLHVRHLRLVSYWSDIEPVQGQYDFSELDYEMQQAAVHGAKVSLAVGLRQPRWPECHAPTWIDTSKSESAWEPQLEQYMTAVINRYKDSPALASYQLENEYFNNFGACNNFDRGRLSRELTLVKKLDPNHPVIMSRSNNYIGMMLKAPLPDIVGISVYRRVWDGTVTKHYFQYPYPSWYYSFLAGGEKLLTGKDSVIHELQTEPWPPHGQDILNTSLAEQNKTFDAKRLKTTTDFAKQTGIRQAYLWGAEYWYYRMQTLHDPSVWQTAEQIYQANPKH